MMSYKSFIEYIKAVEPSKRKKAYAWRTAIGLQAVDGLEPSEYYGKFMYFVKGIRERQKCFL